MLSGLAVVWLRDPRRVGAGAAVAVGIAVLQVAPLVGIAVTPGGVATSGLAALWLPVVLTWVAAGIVAAPALRAASGARAGGGWLLAAGAFAVYLGGQLPDNASAGPVWGPLDALRFGDASTRTVVLGGVIAVVALVVVALRTPAMAGVGAGLVLAGEGVITLSNLPAAVARAEPLTVAPMITLLGTATVAWWCVQTRRGGSTPEPADVAGAAGA